MNAEEKKAIEDMDRFANGIDMSCVTARQMKIILKLIEKLQKENEDLKAKLEYKEYGDLDNTEFEKYINYIVDTRTKELKEENEKLKYKYAEYVKFSIRKIEEMMDEEENK